MRGALRRAHRYSIMGFMTSTVNVPVPAEIADEVRRFAAFLLADRSETGSRAESLYDGIPDYPLWPDEDVIALASAGTATSHLYRRIMDAILKNEATGVWVSIAQLAEWVGERPTLVANFRTQLYRWIGAHLPEGTAAPFTAKRGDKLHPPRAREVHYRVSAPCAEQWRRIQSQLKDSK